MILREYIQRTAVPERKATAFEPEVEGRGVWKSRSYPFGHRSTTTTLRYISAQRLGAFYQQNGVFK